MKGHEIGDFMWLLMEGIRRMDEENKTAQASFPNT